MELSKKEKLNISEILGRPETMVFLVLVFLFIMMSFLRPFSFPTPRNIFNIFRQSSLVAILAVGMGFVIITGGIDLSVGAVIGFTACMSMAVNRALNLPGFAVLIVILGGGCLIGIINGLLISKLKIPPFIVTLGMLSICQGGALVISNGNPIRYEPTWISVFGGGFIGLFPVTILVMVAVLIFGYVFSNFTQMGRNIYAVGNSQQAARLSGISVDRVIITVYAITGTLAGVCSLILIGQMNGGDPSYGRGIELDVIAAAVIGGISMKGGEGRILGVLLGALLMGLLKNMFIQLAVSGFWQTIVLGLVIIGAVSIDAIRRARASR